MDETTASVTKVSDIDAQAAADYLRIVELTANELDTLTTLINVAKAFIQNYTGRTADELDNYQDFVIVVYILVQDMWDNRTLYVDNENLSFVVQSVLGMHSVNLLPQVSNDD